MHTMRSLVVRVIAVQVAALAVLASAIGYLLIRSGDDGAQEPLSYGDIQVVPFEGSQRERREAYALWVALLLTAPDETGYWLKSAASHFFEW